MTWTPSECRVPLILTCHWVSPSKVWQLRSRRMPTELRRCLECRNQPRSSGWTIAWSRGSAERIWGDFFGGGGGGPRILGKLPANFSANIDGEFFLWFFRPFFSRVSGSPIKFTPKIRAQNCRHSSPISLSRTQNLFTPIFCLQRRPK